MKRWILKSTIFVLLVALLHLETFFPTLRLTFRESLHALSPFLFLANCLSGAAAVLGAAALIFGGLILALSLWKRRFFCWWICPLGFLQDVLHRVKLSVVALLPSIFKAPKGTQSRAKCTCFRWVGPLLALTTLGTLIFGGLTFLWLDPLVILEGAHRAWGWQFLLAGIGIFALFYPRFWCFFLCPCGGMQEILWQCARFFRSCRFFPFFCVAEAKKEAQDEATCAKEGEKKCVCESDSSRVESEKSSETVSRRRFFKMAFFMTLCGAAVCGLKKTLNCVSEKSASFLRFRPPGAVAEPEFLARCTRCGACVEVCPTRLLKTLSDQSQPLVLGTPAPDFKPQTLEEQVFCDENCTACSEVCPTGAIRKFKRDEKKNVRLAQCNFELELCRRYYQMECSICLQTCPFGALEEIWSDAAYAKIPSVNPELCTGCGKCVAFCPGEPMIRWSADLYGGSSEYSSEHSEYSSEYSGATDENPSDSQVETTGKKALSLTPLDS